MKKMTRNGMKRRTKKMRMKKALAATGSWNGNVAAAGKVEKSPKKAKKAENPRENRDHRQQPEEQRQDGGKDPGEAAGFAVLVASSEMDGKMKNQGLLMRD
jgi:hypothetical protein